MSLWRLFLWQLQTLTTVQGAVFKDSRSINVDTDTVIRYDAHTI